MSDTSKIEWTNTYHTAEDGTVTVSPGSTWNPIRGVNGRHTCARISSGCDNCYAATMNRRGLGGTSPLDFGRGETLIDPARLDEKALQQPLHWKRPRRIFVCSMTDLFGSWVPDEWLRRIFGVMSLTPQHTYMLLTKRPKRMQAFLAGLETRDLKRGAIDVLLPGKLDTGINNITALLPAQHQETLRRLASPVLPNVWPGTTIESDQFSWRANYLRRTPAAVIWISAEPLLGGLPSLDLGGSLCRRCGGTGTMVIVHLRTNYGRCDQCDGTGQTKRIDWLVAGGESGHKARPMHPDWARDLRDRCAAVGTAFFFKQWGEWLPYEEDAQPPFWNGQDGSTIDGHIFPENLSDGEPVQGWLSSLEPFGVWRRVGKHRAGRLLDGREHNEYPTVVQVGAAS